MESFANLLGAELPVTTAGGSITLDGASPAAAVLLRAGTAVQSGFVLTAGLSLALPITLWITGAQPLAAATLLLRYDPAVLRPTRCTLAAPAVQGYCNPAFEPPGGLVKFNLVSDAGLTGDLHPFDVTFEAVSGVTDGASSLVLIVENLADPTGAALPWQAVNGAVQVVTAAVNLAQVQVGWASSAYTAAHGLTTTVPVYIAGVADLGATTLELHYDASVVRSLGCVVNSDAVGGLDGGVCALYDGRMQANLVSATGITGTIRLFDVTFTPSSGVAPGLSSPLTLTVVNLTDSQAQPIPSHVRNGVITVTFGGSLAKVALVRVGDAVNAGSFTLAQGSQTAITLTVEGASNLAAASLRMGYDPAIVRPVACAASAVLGGGSCNPEAAPGQVRLNVIATPAVTGTTTLGGISFQPADGAAVGASTPLTLTVTNFADPTGAALLYQVAAGRLTITTPVSSLAQVALRAGEGVYGIGIGGLVSVPITATVAPTWTAVGLSVATLMLGYDPLVVQPVGCVLGSAGSVPQFP